MSRELAKQAEDAAAAMLKAVEATLEAGQDHHVVFYEWNGSLFLGRLAYLYPEKPYIVHAAKETAPVSSGTVQALRRRREIPTIKVHPKVEFAGPKYLLGISGDTLCLLSGEDVLYCLVHPRKETRDPYKTGTDLAPFGSSL